MPNKRIQGRFRAIYHTDTASRINITTQLAFRSVHPKKFFFHGMCYALKIGIRIFCVY